MPAPRARTVAAFAASALAACALAVTPLAASAAPDAAPVFFDRTATYPVYLNVPAGVDPAAPTVSEISTISQDGSTVIYTDALGKRIGFVDVSDPAKPVGAGTVELGQIGHADDQPTSVATYGDYLLVVIDETGGDFAHPSGRLEVLRASDHGAVKSFDLGGQPDSIAISKDGKYAAIAMENQRDEAFAPTGKKAGDLPQLPAGFVQVIDLAADVQAWSVTPVPFTNPDGSALGSFVAAGLDTPEDPEPEYVAINGNDKLAVTLQENNGVVIVDLASKAIDSVFSAGTDTVSGIDVKKDGRIDLSGSITNTPREPDSIAWIGNDHLATANEGDWKGGTRGWTVFDAHTGAVAWDAGNSYERLADRHGLYNNDRAAKKGSEPEGLAVGTFDGVPYAFVASERSNFVAVYDVSDPTHPVYKQLLFTTNGPEGILPVPSRGMLVVSSETDDAANGVRAVVNLYRLGNSDPSQPSIVSDEDPRAVGVAAGAPIGWQALSALSADPADPKTLYTASDVAVSPSTVYTVDVSRTPAHITRALTITDKGAPVALDIEGVYARPEGGFWLAIEGVDGPSNKLVRTDAAGAIQQTVTLPADISAHIGKWGFEGLTAIGTGEHEQLFAVIQRPLWTDPKAASGGIDGDDVTRIGRYDLASGTWTWFGYRLEHTSVAGDWMGLSEITAVNENTLAVIERDKLNGPRAAVKRIYTVQVPTTDAAAGSLPILDKTLAIDVLPKLQESGGWTQEKLEGFTIAADGALYGVTDNDGLANATGETVFLRLGDAADVFGAGQQPGEGGGPGSGGGQPGDGPHGTKPVLVLGSTTIAAGGRIVIGGAGFDAGAQVRFELHSDPVVLGTATAGANGAFIFNAVVPSTVPAGPHTLVAILPDGSQVTASVTVTGTASAQATALAHTGVEATGLALAALAVLLPGIVLTLVRRRRTVQ
ncbi:esterase-like activity of phytase family protein [Rathayibacter sp. YIM 133350]|uniref:esterase-like activity of phytase family protein n=1 Tax=Rathayibacter sp. YIM 133350 TaxID=3131992 RepID=UPI00307CF133